MNKGVKVSLNVEPNIIKSNLERMGIVNRNKKKLYPSCYLIKEDGDYYIVHFKELLQVPGQDENDLKRRDTIIWLLKKWGLLTTDEILNKQNKRLFILSINQLKDENWIIIHKWNNKNRGDNNG